MWKFVAKLTGESDEHAVCLRHFDTIESAKEWLQGAGLAEFDDQTARGEVFDAVSGHCYWTKSGLQTVEQREREGARESAYYRGRLQAHSWSPKLPFRPNKPQKR